MNPSLNLLDNLKLERCLCIIFWVPWQISFPKSYNCTFITACLDYLSFEFEDIFLAIYASSLLAPCPVRTFLEKLFPRSHQFDLQFYWLALELSHHARDILNKHAPLLQVCCSVLSINFLEDSIVPARCLWSLLLTFAMFTKFSLIIGCIINNKTG